MAPIDKMNKDKTALENWRPITLLNLDYKLIAKVLALTIKKYYQQLLIKINRAMFRTRILGKLYERY